jgi:ribosomal protein L29
VLDSDHSRELELENMRLMGHSSLGAALKSEIRRLAGGSSTDQEAGRKHELACLRMAADCMQLVGEIRTPDLQRRFLDLARLLTAAAEPAAVPAFAPSV